MRVRTSVCSKVTFFGHLTGDLDSVQHLDYTEGWLFPLKLNSNQTKITDGGLTVQIKHIPKPNEAGSSQTLTNDSHTKHYPAELRWYDIAPTVCPRTLITT